MSTNDEQSPEPVTDVDAADVAAGEAGEIDLEAVLNEAVKSAAAEEAAAQPPSNDELVQAAQREALQAKAELENFRKRMQRESDNQLKYANVPLVRDLLEVVDNLKRAAESAEKDGSDADGAVQGLVEGVRLVSQQFTGVLEKFGCVHIKALGEEFDPNYHEALGQMPSEEYASGKVAIEVAAGYRLHDRVVRPSNVMVSTGAAG